VVARWRAISVPWSQVIDRMSPCGRSCMRVTRAACSPARIQFVYCHRRRIITQNNGLLPVSRDRGVAWEYPGLPKYSNYQRLTRHRYLSAGLISAEAL
jgi:hypothetical protein